MNHSYKQLSNVYQTVLLMIITGSSYGQISFQMGDQFIESIHFTEEIPFSVVESGSDSGLTLVLKDVYLEDTYVDSISPPNPVIYDNTKVTLKQSIVSDASKFLVFSEPPGLPPEYDIGPRDLMITFYFLDYDLSSPWTLNVGDEIKINQGTIYDTYNGTIPNPDNLGATLTGQIFSTNYSIVLTDEINVSVIPEPSRIAVFFGLGAVVMGLLHRKRKGLTSRWS